MIISERGQITIPEVLRDRFGLNHNVEVEITPMPGQTPRPTPAGADRKARLQISLLQGSSVTGCV